jgi:hypothetical protein
MLVWFVNFVWSIPEISYSDIWHFNWFEDHVFLLLRCA